MRMASVGITLVVGMCLVALAAACGQGEEEPATATPSPAVAVTTTPEATPGPERTLTGEATPTSTVSPSRTPGPLTETLLSEELNGVIVELVYQPVSGTHMAFVYGTTPEEYREAKAALEERLSSLVPDPCLVRWFAPIVQMALEPDDLRTSGCQSS